MKLGEAELYLKAQLEPSYGASEAAGMAALALEHLTSLQRGERALKKDQDLSEEQKTSLEQISERLRRHEPIQYIMGKTWFYGMELYVDPSVLIPRPETEELVDWIVKDVKASGLDVFEKRPMKADETTLLKILDVGTGSGCIALALKKAMPRAEVWGCDTSDEALNVARRNGSALDIRVDFQGLNFLDEAQQKLLPTVDILVSNPPYIPLQEKSTMHPNVVDHEPHTALFVPDNDVLVFYKALAQFATHRLYRGGKIYMEIHENLAEGVLRLFNDLGFETELRKDMQGKERMIRALK